VTETQERERGAQRDNERDGRQAATFGDADEEEAAAIVAALSIHLREADGESDDGEPGWEGRRWAFAGRSDALGGRAVRVPTGAPADDWTALGRADRL